MRLTAIAENSTCSNFYWMLLPLALIGLLIAIFQSLLKRLGHLSFVSQILAVIAIGPTCLGRIDVSLEFFMCFS
ncbi:hypothetical protein Patl1_35391 [Pistacia atlantica]|nr:hypothetical protein Patl1_35391 [Pistacia atlantica]